MLKYVLLAIALIWLFYSPALRGLGKKRSTPASPPTPPSQAEAMVPCAHCGVHLPRGDALFDVAGHPYCSATHRQAGPRAL